ncbi:MAG TPA: CoA-binding protein [Anaeromyxobacteraceae bacterium]|nr:CoA-binding protein [Anaeromyxobacteraceae bacterium]
MQSDAGGASWREHLLEDDARIRALLARTRRVAVLGMRTEARRDRPAFYVPAALKRAGLEIVPVPVYHPEATEILGARVYRRVSDVPGQVDLVDVFRRPVDIPSHLDDLVAARPGAVWFQLGIRNDEAARVLAQAGIDVVQDRCLKVEWARLGPGRG